MGGLTDGPRLRTLSAAKSKLSNLPNQPIASSNLVRTSVSKHVDRCGPRPASRIWPLEKKTICLQHGIGQIPDVVGTWTEAYILHPVKTATSPHDSIVFHVSVSSPGMARPRRE